MPKVLIFGATGYLGKNVASLLVRSGQHTVYGIARSEAKAKPLALQEIIPVICPDPVNEPAPYLEAIRVHHIDIVVDLAGANHDSHHFLGEIKKVGEERLAAYQAAGIQGPKLGFIYCSGTWVHGSSETPVNDLELVGPSAITPPAELVAWRVGLEKAVLAASNALDVAILRAALIYGREGTIWTTFILPLLEAARAGSTGTLQIPLDPKARPGLIHVDDAASAFKDAIEKLSLLNSGSVYPVFDLVTSQESMSAIFEALARAWGYKGRYELAGTGDNLFARAMSTTMRGSSSRAKQLLGWQPTRLEGYVQDMDRFAAAFAAQY
jgi:nucleoside-diphosphate-sugar epimerase